jgi:hypothetical protein
MIILHYIAYFFAGLFLCNSIPHITAGLRGEPFPSPFSKPRGVGYSPAVVNFFWGTANGVVGIVFLTLSSFTLGLNLGSTIFLAAFLIIGAPLSIHFESVRLNRQKEKNMA